MVFPEPVAEEKASLTRPSLRGGERRGEEKGHPLGERDSEERKDRSRSTSSPRRGNGVTVAEYFGQKGKRRK